MIDKNSNVYKIIEETVKETFNGMLTENKKEKDDSIIILENLRNGIRNVEKLDEAKKKDKKKKSEKKSDSGKKDGKKKSKKGENEKLKDLRRQVLSMLNQDKFDMAAVARQVYPKMDDDARRSYVSRQSRGLEPIPDNKVTSYYHALRSASRGRKGMVSENDNKEEK